MRKRTILAIFLALLGVALVGGAAWTVRHHLVRTDRGIVVLQKRFLTPRDTLVDIRAWTAADFVQHADLRRALIAQGYGDLVVEQSVREQLRSAGQDLRGAARELKKDIRETVNELLKDDTPAPAPSPSAP